LKISALKNFSLTLETDRNYLATLLLLLLICLPSSMLYKGRMFGCPLLIYTPQSISLSSMWHLHSSGACCDQLPFLGKCLSKHYSFYADGRPVNY